MGDSKSFLTSMYDIDQKSYQIAVTVVLALNFVICPYLIYMSRNKIKKMKDPIQNNSYNLVTVKMLEVLIVGLICTIVNSIINILCIILKFDIKPKETFFENDTGYKIIHLTLIVLEYSGMICCEITIYLQGYEWFSLLSVILLQKGKSLPELTYEQNNTDFLKKFQRKERCWRYLFRIVITLICVCVIALN